MAGDRPQALLAESSGFLGVALLVLVEVPLLLVGHGLEPNQEQHQASSNKVDHIDWFRVVNYGQDDRHCEAHNQEALVVANKSEIEDLPHDRVCQHRVLPQDRPPVVLFTLPGLELPAVFATTADSGEPALPREVESKAHAPDCDAETHDHLPRVHS